MIDVMILEEAIKKAKEELALKLESGTSGTGSALAQLKSSLETKLSPWTGTRAAKLDNLDAKVSSRADGSYYTPARASKLDKLDATVSSRASGSQLEEVNKKSLNHFDAKCDSLAQLSKGLQQVVGTSSDERVTQSVYGGIREVYANVLKNQTNISVPRSSCIKTYNISNSSTGYPISPLKTPAGTTIFSAHGAGRILYIGTSVRKSSSDLVGVILDVEVDGKTFYSIQVTNGISSSQKHATNALIYSAEGLLLNKRLSGIVTSATLVPLSKYATKLTDSYPIKFFRDEPSQPLVVCHAYNGNAKELSFEHDFRVSVKNFIGDDEKIDLDLAIAIISGGC